MRVSMLKYLQRHALTRQCSTRSLIRRASFARGDPFTYQVQQRRQFLGIPDVLAPPVIFCGLFIGLWTWKCFMMVVFQNKIIYMPGLPPNARGEKIENYKSQCGGIEWEEVGIRSEDGTKISLCVASVTNGMQKSDPEKLVYILYFQGNASSIPPRLPELSPVLRSLRDKPSKGPPVKYIMVLCSYRGYWTSRGRPSEIGIMMDAAAALRWIRDISKFAARDNGVSVVVWGQSIGAGVASNLAAQEELFSDISLKLLILETPFISIRAMLEALYPQKWLPYRYLWPFLRNHLDSFKALGTMRHRYDSAGCQTPKILILEAGKDELVPREHGDSLEERCRQLGLNVRRKICVGALHSEVMFRSGGRIAVVEAVHDITSK